MIRPAVPADSPALIALAEATGIFKPDEAEALLGGVLNELHEGNLGKDHRAMVWVDVVTNSPAGWVYFAATEKADGVWDLWWIGVDPTRQGSGIGSALLGSVENQVRESHGRLLVIETSSQPALEQSRCFYAKHGYQECGIVPHFYGDGDGKVIYAKRIEA